MNYRQTSSTYTLSTHLVSFLCLDLIAVMTITLPGGCPLLAEGHVVHRLACSSQGLFFLFSVFSFLLLDLFSFSFYSLTLIAKALLHVWSLDVRWKSTWKLTGFYSTAAFRVEPYNIKMYASQWLKGVDLIV